jgi:hypothetical protein
MGMRQIPDTSIVGKEGTYGELRETFARFRFHLGGNWDYDHGSFDRILAEEGEATIYVRVPFDVTEGELDAPEAKVVFGNPYVLKHVVQTDTTLNEEGFDSGLLNQFQEPADPDAGLDGKWVEEGRRVVEEVARTLQ